MRDTLLRWGWESSVDDAVLVASELVGNALRHGLPPVVLTVRRDGLRVVITVWDRGDRAMPESPSEAMELAGESGRGLMIVAALCASLSWRADDRGGKAVTAVLEIPASGTVH